MRFQWCNVPVPKAHVARLAVGILLQVIVGGRLFAAPWRHTGVLPGSGAAISVIGDPSHEPGQGAAFTVWLPAPG